MMYDYHVIATLPPTELLRNKTKGNLALFIPCDLLR